MNLSEIFGELPRQGPGSSQSSLRALSMMAELPMQLTIADLGCGTGSQTRLLARATGGEVVAMDHYAPYLRSLEKQALAAGVADQIKTVEGDISQPELEAGSFDIVWSEGAAYAIGFEKALDAWTPLLKEGGYLALTECSWLRKTLSDRSRAFWAEAYPEMRDVAGNRALIVKRGLTPVEEFPLPVEAWWDEFYTPLEQRLDTLDSTSEADAQIIDGLRREIELFRASDHEYGYVFYVARKGAVEQPDTHSRSWFARLRGRSS